MKILITYWSQTGNTKRVAETIFEALEGNRTLRPMSEVESLGGFDLVFIGFPVMQFGPPPAARNFIKLLVKDSKIALFVTHAIPSSGHDPHQQAMLEKELDKCRALCSHSQLLGTFHCQGELAEKTANELMATNIQMLMEFAGMRALTIGHPNPEELLEAATFARKMISVAG